MLYIMSGLLCIHRYCMCVVSSVYTLSLTAKRRKKSYKESKPADRSRMMHQKVDSKLGHPKKSLRLLECVGFGLCCVCLCDEWSQENPDHYWLAHSRKIFFSWVNWTTPGQVYCAESQFKILNEKKLNGRQDSAVSNPTVCTSVARTTFSRKISHLGLP